MRGFFTGGLGWTPRTVLHDATLDDLVDAYDGYHRLRGGDIGHGIGRAFLQMMAQKFPDTRTP